jgi:hypothetical protein
VGPVIVKAVATTLTVVGQLESYLAINGFWELKCLHNIEVSNRPYIKSMVIPMHCK